MLPELQAAHPSRLLQKFRSGLFKASQYKRNYPKEVSCPRLKSLRFSWSGHLPKFVTQHLATKSPHSNPTRSAKEGTKKRKRDLRSPPLR
jgi:hypothetical protein